MMTRTGLLFLLLGLFQGVAWSEDLFVLNKPFKGQVSGAGADIYVELAPMAKALGLEVKEEGGGWVLFETGHTAGAARPGEVVANDRVVKHQAGPLVSLQDLAAALGLKVVRNKGMGTVDVYRDQSVGRSNVASPGGLTLGKRRFASKDGGSCNFLLPEEFAPLANSKAETSSWCSADGKLQIHVTLVYYVNGATMRSPQKEAQEFSAELVNEGMTTKTGTEKVSGHEVATVLSLAQPRVVNVARGTVPERRKTIFGEARSASISIVTEDQATFDSYRQDIERMATSLVLESDEVIR